ncbi:hypothetical protein CVT25_013915 [Psilocybe cyanescens]|uniref:Uncharacterized protein n=1 Tax=Psilocybe cyanescens TaxID=93625 RepID=A0A409XPF6_PSICY|nr:hypothetical protein CVT25_013915 [Psilocybe cyanescens]
MSITPKVGTSLKWPCPESKDEDMQDEMASELDHRPAHTSAKKHKRDTEQEEDNKDSKDEESEMDHDDNNEGDDDDNDENLTITKIFPGSQGRGGPREQKSCPPPVPSQYITAEEVKCWKALNNIFPLLEDRIEKLEALAAQNSRASDKSSSETHVLPALTTGLPAGASLGPGPDPYLYRSSNVISIANDNVEMEHLEGQGAQVGFEDEPVHTIPVAADPALALAPTTPALTIPAPASVGTLSSLPVVSYSSEDDHSCMPAPGTTPALPHLDSSSHQPVVITRRLTPVSPLHGCGNSNLVDHGTGDEMDEE